MCLEKVQPLEAEVPIEGNKQDLAIAVGVTLHRLTSSTLSSPLNGVLLPESFLFMSLLVVSDIDFMFYYQWVAQWELHLAE